MVDLDLLVPRNDIYEIPSRKGIYILFSDKEVPLYIGQSVNIRHRVTAHFSGKNYNLISLNVDKVHAVGIIFCSDSDNLNELEQKYISLLKPVLNIDKVDYVNEIDIQSVRSLGLPKFTLCKHSDETPCDRISTRNGYCHHHDPNKVAPVLTPSWVRHGKLITTELQRLLHDSPYKRQSLYFYMSNITFGKLLQEKTFAEIDYINEEIVLTFKKHLIIIDEDETIRLEVIKKR